jgi:hypothetical protein
VKLPDLETLRLEMSIRTSTQHPSLSSKEKQYSYMEIPDNIDKALITVRNY